MRTIELRLYNFIELPTDKAKAKAREWFRENICIDHDSSDYSATLDACVCWLERMDSMKEVLAALPEEGADTVPWKEPTNVYHWDFSALEIIRNHVPRLGNQRDTLSLETAVRTGMDKEWSAELDSRGTDEYVDECLKDSEYEFTADGTHFKDEV